MVIKVTLIMPFFKCILLFNTLTNYTTDNQTPPVKLLTFSVRDLQLLYYLLHRSGRTHSFVQRHTNRYYYTKKNGLVNTVSNARR